MMAPFAWIRPPTPPTIPPFTFSRSLEDKTASADYNDEDLLVCKTFFLGGHLSRDVDDRAENSLYRAADAANNRLQQRTHTNVKS